MPSSRDLERARRDPDPGAPLGRPKCFCRMALASQGPGVCKLGWSAPFVVVISEPPIKQDYRLPCRRALSPLAGPRTGRSPEGNCPAVRQGGRLQRRRGRNFEPDGHSGSVIVVGLQPNGVNGMLHFFLKKTGLARSQEP